MTKKDIHQRFIEQLTEELESITAVAKETFATATNDEHQARNRHDTFKLESSFLARGQAKRVEELTDALESFHMLPLKKLNAASPIQLGALVKLEASDKTTRNLFFCSAAGGETIIVNGEEITIVTPRSPLGEALLGKTAGNTFDIKIGFATQTYTVRSVE
jgi:transcription elongation GreA/GreB family factor